MDNTIADFNAAMKADPLRKYPQGKIGFFANLTPIPGAIESLRILEEHYEIWFLTKPSIKNIHCYTEKAQWIREYFGEDALNRLIICPDKSIVGEGDDILIDDWIGDGQENFKGTWIRYGIEKFKNWEIVTEFLIKHV